MENIDEKPMVALLPGQLRADRRAGRRRLFPRAVPARQSAARTSRSTRSSTASRAKVTTSARTWRGACNNTGWWGEGEIKFYMDGDSEFPTICGTGTEDYFCGSYNFENQRRQQQYQEFTTPYSGLPQVMRPDGVYQSQQRFGLYRWHITDPIRFEQDLRVTIQALGWRSERPLPAAAGRHRVGGVLVSGRAARAVPGAAGSRRARDPVSWPTRSGSRVAIVCLLVGSSASRRCHCPAPRTPARGRSGCSPRRPR